MGLFFVFISYQSHGTNSDTLNANELLAKSLELQRSDPDQAYQLAAQAYGISQKCDYKKGMGSAFMRMGSILYAKGKNDSAQRYLNQALQIRKILNDYKGAAGASIVLSYVYNTLGKKEPAFASLYEALHLNEQSHDTTDIIDTYISLGNLYLEYGDSSASLKSYLTAESLAKKINNPKELALVYGGLGNYRFSHHQYQKALQYFIQKLTIDESFNDATNASQTLNNIALCYAQLQEYVKASIFYHRAAAQYKWLNMRNDEGLVYFNLGSLFNNRNQPDSAIYFLLQSLQIAREVDDLNRVASSYEYLSDAYALKGDYLKAYDFHLKYSAAKDSLMDQDKINSIAEMQTKYDTEKKEQEIQLLDEQNRTQSAQRNFFIAGSILLLLALIFLGYYYWQRSKLAKQNEVIASQKIASLLNEQEIKTYNAMIEGQEEERKRISVDLHDRLGSMLSTVKLMFGALDAKITQNQDDNNAKFTQVNKLLDEACDEVRRISHNLSTSMVMRFGLSSALTELCSGINDSGVIRCKLLQYGLEERLESSSEIEIYRMVQEIVNNILKHAKATVITIQINKLDDALNITVEDDGVGFRVDEAMERGGLGLNNISMRAKKLSGTYHIDSQPGKGTISIIEIPISHD